MPFLIFLLTNFIESLRLEKTSKIIQSNHLQNCVAWQWSGVRIRAIPQNLCHENPRRVFLRALEEKDVCTIKLTLKTQFKFILK